MLRDAIMEEQKRRRAIAMVLVLCYCASVGWALIRNKDISRRIEEIVSSVCQKISTPIVDQMGLNLFKKVGKFCWASIIVFLEGYD